MEKFGSAIVLAGGKSTRMGFDKKYLEIGGTRLAERLASVLGTEFREVIFVINHPAIDIVPGCRTVCDEVEGMGPLGGLHAGLRHASSEYAYVVACDMPNINIEYIRFMKNKIGDLDVDACTAESGGRIETFNAFYSACILKDIETDLKNGSKSLNKLLRRLHCLFIDEGTAREFSPDWSMFANLNTREDLAEWRQKNIKS